jgi:mRNA interferase MazF
VLCHQPKSFDWAVRGAGKHPWGAAPKHVLREALDRLDAICGICEN